MAPKTLSAEEKEREKEKEKQKRFNRQINFYYMRHMWQLVCGRSEWHNEDTIYNALNIRRERYTRVIDSGIIRYGKGELDDLVKTTGLPKEIFTGEIRFACKYSTEEGTIQSITDEKWENLFTWRNKRQELRAEKSKLRKVKLKNNLKQNITVWLKILNSVPSVALQKLYLSGNTFIKAKIYPIIQIWDYWN